MDDGELECLCGKTFPQANALSNHRNACGRSKKRMADALERTKEVWQAKQEALRLKRQKRDVSNGGAPAAQHTSEPDPFYDSLLPPGDQTSQFAAGTAGEASTGVSTEVMNNAEECSLQLPVAVRKGRRQKKLPQRFRDIPPQPLAILPPNEDPVPECTPPRGEHSADASFAPPPVLRSPSNAFGLYREFYSHTFPTHDPDEETTSSDLSDIPDVSLTPLPDDAQYWPYPNKSCYLLSEWYWNTGAQKSRDNLQKLINVLVDEGFDLDSIKDAPWTSFTGDASASPPNGVAIDLEDNWSQKDVSITVPFRRSAATGCTGPQNFFVGKFYCRSIVDIMRERITGPEGRHFHYEPYELRWKPGGIDSPKPSQRVYGELYTSPSFVEAHSNLQASPPEPGCTLQRVVVALMFASDETHLAQFGETKLWPLYLHFGNDSKYRRCKSSLNLCNHVAYLIRLPETFKGFVHKNTSAKSASASLAAHCLREALHAQMDLILDDDFMHAYLHGVVFPCFDGQDRRFYPRVFTFSSDYKDKVVWTGIRNLGTKPCPRCLIPLTLVHNMGMKRDAWWRTKRARADDEEYRDVVTHARSAVLESNFALHGKHVDAILKDQSLVAVENTFSKKLSACGLNVFKTMVVDFMHEVESGNWRSLFIHLLRILDCAGGGVLISELDSRYRQVPSFGQDTIRKLRRNCSEMKNLAARDWEDMLQTAIPVFDGLLATRFDHMLQKLLYTFAYWHGLAKLRMHTDATLDLLADCTTSLGDQLRSFKSKTSEAFETRELQKEAAARRRRTDAAAKKAKERAQAISLAGPARSGDLLAAEPELGEGCSTEPAAEGGGRYERRPKVLNLNTYKFHAMGDYVATIRHFGTVDSYSTEIGELEHRKSKARYSRTSKKDYVKQLARIERRQARLKRIGHRTGISISNRRTKAAESLAKSPDLPYWMGTSQNSPSHLLEFVKRNAGDPAAKGFIGALKAHIQPRAETLFNQSQEGARTHRQPFSFFFQRDRMYEHQTLRLNHTTYDLRRCQDFINPKTQCNVMLLASPTEGGLDDASEAEHPFIYARVLKIFHVNIVCTGPEADGSPRRFDILWVRWYQHIPPRSEFELDRVSFPPVGEGGALGFVDPADVLRACHLIPRFSQEQRFADGVGASRLANDSKDWKEYYINRFVDRDMLMRYHWGLGVGHQYSSPPVWPFADTPDQQQESASTGQEKTSEAIIEQDEIADGNSSDGDFGLRDRENEDLGSEHSSDDGAWVDDLEDEGNGTDSDVESGAVPVGVRRDNEI